MRIFISLKGPGHLGDMNFDLFDIDDINQVKGHIMHSSNHNVNHEFHPKSIIDTKISTQAVQAVCNSYLHARKRNGCALHRYVGTYEQGHVCMYIYVCMHVFIFSTHKFPCIRIE